MFLTQVRLSTDKLQSFSLIDLNVKSRRERLQRPGVERLLPDHGKLGHSRRGRARLIGRGDRTARTITGRSSRTAYWMPMFSPGSHTWSESSKP